MKSHIARKLILYTVLFSSVITLIITSIQLYTEFQYDIKGINKALKQIEISYKKSITQAVWVSDTERLQTILDGITKLPDIAHAEVIKDNNDIVFSGQPPTAEKIEFKSLLNYTYNNKRIKIGELTVTASLSDVYHRLLNRLWIILLSNALKTSLVAIFIYFLFSYLVTRHLTKMSNFSENSDVFSHTQKLTLNRPVGENDELEIVVKSINDMHKRLHEQVSEISKQKKHLLQTLNSIGDAVITTDDQGYVTRLNPVAEKLTGWSTEQALHKPLKSIFPIIDITTGEAIPNPVEKVLTMGETVYLSNNTTLIAKDGSEYQIADSAAPILDDGVVLGMVLVFNDVTEQYKMREALYESEQRLRQLAENLNEVFWLGSPDWNEIIYITPAYEKVWGKSIENLYVHPREWIESIHPDDKQQVIDEIPESINDIENCVEFSEFRIIKGNEVVWIKSRAYPIRDAEGIVVRIAGIAEDITKQKNSDEIIRRSQKMDALGKLTGGIAHDYNNMLGVILGYANILHDELDEKPKLQNYINQIIHAGERSVKLTKKLLGFSRNKSVDVKETSINSVLLANKNMLEKTVTARIKLIYKFNDKLCPVFIDANELEDAILNISINAMHAIKGNGIIVIETNNKSFNRIEADALSIQPGKYAQITIMDDGCGMDEKVREKIFDPFFSTKGESGTGLGLSQVYGFIQRCHGTITVNSSTESGSVFNLFFPCYTGCVNHIEPDNSVEHDDFSGKESILIVDDEPALMLLSSDILRKNGYQVFHTDNAKQALDIMASEVIDVLITDVVMPDIDGYRLASIVHKKYPSVKIQLVSGYTGSHITDEMESERNRALSKTLLEKPFTSESLLRKVKELLMS